MNRLVCFGTEQFRWDLNRSQNEAGIGEGISARVDENREAVVSKFWPSGKTIEE